MIKPMYCLCLAAAVTLACGTPRAPAQAAPRAPARAYTNTLQLYNTPDGLPTPKLVEEQDKPAREEPDRNEGISGAPMLLNAGVNAGARTPARTDKKKKDKDRNWIEAEGKKGEDDDERKPSGWGWLADDVRKQQEKKDGQSGEDEEQEEDTADLRDESLGETIERNTDKSDSSSKDDKAYTPVDADKLLKNVAPTGDRMTGSSDAAGRNTGRDDAPSTSTRDPAAASSSPDRAPTVTESKSGADSLWNSDRSWGQRPEQPSTVLPLTSRALSDPLRPGSKSMNQSVFTPSAYKGPSPSSFMIKTPLSTAPSSPSASPFSPSPGIGQPSSAGGIGGFGGFSSGGGTPVPLEPVKPLQPSQPLSDSFLK